MSNDIGTFVFDKLIAGAQDIVTEPAVAVSGAGVLVRGTVLGRITASGKLKTVNSANSDGSQTPYAILAEGVDATSADAPISVILAGEVNSAALIFGGTDTAATHKAALRDIGIFLKSTQAAVN